MLELGECVRCYHEIVMEYDSHAERYMVLS